MSGVGHDTADRLGRALTDSGSVGMSTPEQRVSAVKPTIRTPTISIGSAFMPAAAAQFHDGLALRSLVGNRREYAADG